MERGNGVYSNMLDDLIKEVLPEPFEKRRYLDELIG